MEFELEELNDELEELYIVAKQTDVKRLKDSATVIQTLDSALNKVKQNCCEENTSCYNCIRNYYNQKHHKYLTRIDAINGINYMLEN